MQVKLLLRPANPGSWRSLQTPSSFMIALDDKAKMHDLGLVRHWQSLLQGSWAILWTGSNHPTLPLQLFSGESWDSPLAMVSVLLQDIASFLNQVFGEAAKSIQKQKYQVFDHIKKWWRCKSKNKKYAKKSTKCSNFFWLQSESQHTCQKSRSRHCETFPHPAGASQPNHDSNGRSWLRLAIVPPSKQKPSESHPEPSAPWFC